MTPLERATHGVKAEMMKQFGKHVESSKRPIHYARAALDAAPDFDQLTEYLHLHTPLVGSPVHQKPGPDCVGCVVEDMSPVQVETLVRAFFAYLQQGIEQEQPHLAAVAA